MSRRAFLPAPLIEAQPRVYKSFRGRQLKGLLFGAGGAALVLMMVGLRDFTGYALGFLAALPGFAYGYYQPEGRPVEDWIKILYRYYATSQRISAVPHRRMLDVTASGPALRAAWRVLRQRRSKQRRHHTSGR